MRNSTRRKSPYQAIRATCRSCSGGHVREIALCRVVDCALWQFRHGLHPQTAMVKFPALMHPETVALLGDLRACRELLNESGPTVRSWSFFQQTVARAADHRDPVVSEKLAAIVASNSADSDVLGDLCSDTVPVGTEANLGQTSE